MSLDSSTTCRPRSVEPEAIDTFLPYMAHVCFYVCRNICCVAAVVKDSVFGLGVLKCVGCLCKVCDVCCVFCLYCDAWSCMCSFMGSMNVSSCRCCMFVSCVHPVEYTMLNFA